MHILITGIHLIIGNVKTFDKFYHLYRPKTVQFGNNFFLFLFTVSEAWKCKKYGYKLNYSKITQGSRAGTISFPLSTETNESYIIRLKSNKSVKL